MKPTEKHKICPQCDGRIALDAESCIYCGASFSGSLSPFADNQIVEESIVSSLYPPPYSNKSSLSSTAPLGGGSPSLGNIGGINASAEEPSQETKGSIWPVLTFSLGANFLALGLLQLFFSDNGLLSLEWKSSYWFLYCLGALPLLFLGFKKLK